VEICRLVRTASTDLVKSSHVNTPLRKEGDRNGFQPEPPFGQQGQVLQFPTNVG